MAQSAIEPGDRFVKVSVPGTVWVVLRPAQLSVDIPPHVYLALAENPSRTLMMSESALLDRKFFRRVKAE